MAEGFSEDSDVGDLLEEVSLTDNPSEIWWNEFLERLPNCARKATCLVDSAVTTSESLAGRVGEKLKEQHETTMIENPGGYSLIRA